jgi:hypothetical protein
VDRIKPGGDLHDLLHVDANTWIDFVDQRKCGSAPQRVACVAVIAGIPPSRVPHRQEWHSAAVGRTGGLTHPGQCVLHR